MAKRFPNWVGRADVVVRMITELAVTRISNMLTWALNPRSAALCPKVFSLNQFRLVEFIWPSRSVIVRSAAGTRSHRPVGSRYVPSAACPDGR